MGLSFRLVAALAVVVVALIAEGLDVVGSKAAIGLLSGAAVLIAFDAAGRLVGSSFPPRRSGILSLSVGRVRIVDEVDQERPAVRATSGDVECSMPILDFRRAQDVGTLQGEPLALRSWRERKQVLRLGRREVAVIRWRSATEETPATIEYDFGRRSVNVAFQDGVEHEAYLRSVASTLADETPEVKVVILAHLASEQYRRIWPARWRFSEKFHQYRR